jgi:PEP-CTERM motif
LAGADNSSDDVTNFFVNNEELSSAGSDRVLEFQATDGSMFARVLTKVDGLALTTTYQSALASPTPEVGKDVYASLAAGIAPILMADMALQAVDPYLTSVPYSGGFWLPAGSTATLSGEASLDATVRLDDELVDPARVNIIADASINMTMQKGTPGMSVFDAQFLDGNQSFSDLAWADSFSADVGIGLVIQPSQQKSLLASLQNLSNEDQWVIFSTVLKASHSLFVAPIPAVPEPTTLALNALGLAGVLAVTRRQRARMQAP